MYAPPNRTAVTIVAKTNEIAMVAVRRISSLGMLKMRRFASHPAKSNKRINVPVGITPKWVMA
jgi:hypothetical protein